MTPPKGFVNPHYEVRRWNYNGWTVGLQDIEHDGAGKIYVALQVTNHERNNAKECWVCTANPKTLKLDLLVIIPEIYGGPQFYVGQDGMGIVHGKDEAQENTCKVSVPGWTRRTDVRK
jgi:hypothetical protein